MSTTPLSIDDISSPALQTLVKDAKSLYEDKFGSASGGAFCTVAPGRVNLIGEHTDYTGGFVLPLAIDYSTVVYGSGSVVSTTTTSTIELISKLSPDKVETKTITLETEPPTDKEAHSSWTWFVVGVVAQYLPDLPTGSAFKVKLSIAGNVPLGGGLSSSASLEVATARFLECILGEEASFSSSEDKLAPKVRAIRCQKAENDWCHSPCGIMDQYVSSAASEGTLLLIDCRSFEYQGVQMKQPSTVTLVITNSNVKHSIGGGEYPVRVKQCQTATTALQKVDASIKTLRDATFETVEKAEGKMDEVSFRRARHVVTENARTIAAKKFLEAGKWAQLGGLMNRSHSSMRDDYEVSCEEIDILVDLAQTFEGVYGSRLTGGGFGGCTVTLVEKDRADALIKHLTTEYKAKTGTDCDCFETSPGPGARLLGTD
jgi:galactokinase